MRHVEIAVIRQESLLVVEKCICDLYFSNLWEFKREKNAAAVLL